MYKFQGLYNNFKYGFHNEKSDDSQNNVTKLTT